jgi:uncharacterized protein YndB with AHSA1/START domain
LAIDLIERSINNAAMLRLALAALLFLAPAAASAQEVIVSDRHEADGTLTLSHEVIVPAPRDAVWAALATPEGWRTWATPVSWVPADDPDGIEGSYNPEARPGGTDLIRQHVLARLPGRLLVFRTVRAPQGFPHFETYARVTIFIELESVDAGHTRVRLTGTGYADDEAGRLLFGFFRDGNRISLERLRQRFVSGPLDWAAIRAAER